MHSGDGCDLPLFDFRKGDLFVLSEAGKYIFSELIMCGGSVQSILLLHLVARCLETIQ